MIQSIESGRLTSTEFTTLMAVSTLRPISSLQHCPSTPSGDYRSILDRRLRSWPSLPLVGCKLALLHSSLPLTIITIHAMSITQLISYSACFVSILRLQALVLMFQHPEDTTWYSPPAAYWSCIEVNLGIICACAPAIRPVLVRIVPRVFGTPAYGSRERSSKPHPEFIELDNRKSEPFTTIKSNGARPGSSNGLQEGGAWKGFGQLTKPLPIATANTTMRINVSHGIEQTSWRGDEDSDGYINGDKRGAGSAGESTIELVHRESIGQRP